MIKKIIIQSEITKNLSQILSAKNVMGFIDIKIPLRRF